MTATQAFKFAMKNEEFAAFNDKFCNNYEDKPAGCFIYVVGDEAFSRSSCKVDGIKNNKMPKWRARQIINSGSYCFRF